MRAPAPLLALANDVFDIRAHGEDERIAVRSFHDSRLDLHELAKPLAGGT